MAIPDAKVFSTWRFPTPRYCLRWRMEMHQVHWTGRVGARGSSAGSATGILGCSGSPLWGLILLIFKMKKYCDSLIWILKSCLLPVYKSLVTPHCPQKTVQSLSTRPSTYLFTSFTTDLMIFKPGIRNYFTSQLYWALSASGLPWKLLHWSGTHPFLSSSPNSFRSPLNTLLYCSCYRSLELSRVEDER